MDTGGIEVTLQNAGNVILQTGNIFTSASKWTYFEMPFGGTSIPDTLRIDLYAKINYSGIGGSILYLDDLQLSIRNHTRQDYSPLPKNIYDNGIP